MQPLALKNKNKISSTHIMKHQIDIFIHSYRKFNARKKIEKNHNKKNLI